MTRLAQKLRLMFFVQCERASELASESLERKLAVHERVALRGHQVGCWSCRQFEKQLRFMKTALNKLGEDEIRRLDTPLPDEPRLSETAKTRLKSIRISGE